MNEHIEQARQLAINITRWAISPSDASRAEEILAALAKIEADHARVTGELADCQLESIPSRRHSDASWQRQNDALRARVKLLTNPETLAQVLCKIELGNKFNQLTDFLEEVARVWKRYIPEAERIINDMNHAAPEQKEPAQPQPDCYCDTPSEFIGACPRHQFIQEPAQPPLPTLAEVRALLNELRLEMNGAELYLRECDGDSGIADWARKTTDSIAVLLARIPEGK